MADEFSDKLIAFAKRNINSAERCTNEESTKMFLVLPFVNFLGYDDRNPHEVCPEHAADFSDKYKNRVDYAILQDDNPIIAIECKCCGFGLKDERGQLRRLIPLTQVRLYIVAMPAKAYAANSGRINIS
ncbi:MAG: hypothetical protein WBW73_13180 [Rhodoplanes sp.]